MSGPRIPRLGPSGEGWVLGQLVLLVAIGAFGAMELTRFSLDGPLRWAAVLAGPILILAGGLVSIRGIRDLGSSLTAVPRPKEDSALVRSGIYRRIRHPVYAGMLLWAFGWALFSWSLIAFALSCLLGLWLDLKARLEEGWLVERYASYADYRASSRRFLPGIY